MRSATAETRLAAVMAGVCVGTQRPGTGGHRPQAYDGICDLRHVRVRRDECGHRVVEAVQQRAVARLLSVIGTRDMTAGENAFRQGTDANAD